jgi:hypothetical protein
MHMLANDGLVLDRMLATSLRHDVFVHCAGNVQRAAIDSADRQSGCGARPLTRMGGWGSGSSCRPPCPHRQPSSPPSQSGPVGGDPVIAVPPGGNHTRARGRGTVDVAWRPVHQRGRRIAQTWRHHNARDADDDMETRPGDPPSACWHWNQRTRDSNDRCEASRCEP